MPLWETMPLRIDVLLSYFSGTFFRQLLYVVCVGRRTARVEGMTTGRAEPPTRNYKI